MKPEDAGSNYVKLVANGPRLREIVENKDDDDVLELFGDVAAQIVSPHWDVHVSQKGYADLTLDAGERLTTHSILKPSLFTGFKSVTLAAACFEETLLYRLWANQGVTLTPADAKLFENLRYETHPNGDLITIHYAFPEDWSKQLRNKVIETESDKISIGDVVKGAVLNLFGNDPFLWMANNDVSDDFFAVRPHAQRLPNSPHGLNSFQGFHKVVVLSALNPTPAQFKFLDEKGVNGDEVRTAISRYAVYQAVIRSSARNPDDKTPKDFVVMDRATAEWLAGLFPGAKVQSLPGLPTEALKGKPGRKSKHKSNGAKTAAYRQRRGDELLDQLARINEASFAEPDYSFLSKTEPNPCYENTYEKGQFVTPFSHGDVFGSIYDSTACIAAGCATADELIAVLRDLHTRVLAAKDEAGLISPSTYDPNASQETSRGLANIKYVNGVWLDNDGGDLGFEEFARLFPYLRMVVWNTYSHTPQKPRWRVFIPTSKAMSPEVYRLIMAEIEAVLNKHGYWRQKQLNKNARIKNGRRHGFDESKFNAASLFYLPCQAKNPADSFFREFDEPWRGPLNVERWLGDCIATLRPEPELEPETDFAAAAAPTPPVSEGAICERLTQLRQKLQADRAAKPSQIIEDAEQEWRRAPQGHGHEAFFRLARKLHWAGITGSHLQQKLREEADHAHSRKDRRAEINGIVKKLDQSGKIGGRRAA